MRIDRVVALAFALAFMATLGGCSFFDGPTGPFPGGRLRTGELVSEPDVDWALATRDVEPLFIELQLVEPPRSRTTGAMVYEGQLYVPCDLGFLWRRAPAPARWVLHLIYVFKRWHEDASEDGRVVVRIRDTRYRRQAVRVTDPELVAKLRTRVEEEAEKMLGAPLGEVPTDDPNDIWFFRLDPRPALSDLSQSEPAAQQGAAAAGRRALGEVGPGPVRARAPDGAGAFDSNADSSEGIRNARWADVWRIRLGPQVLAPHTLLDAGRLRWNLPEADS